ncbi:MAG TPA: DUF1573 domain-containing protein [Thermoanaerobaculia bacterium]|nr:DUF1573 domain-containing protein [Thermoanaerobaculia bacterium]
MSSKRFLVVAMAALVSVSALAADSQKQTKAKKDDAEAAEKTAKASAATASKDEEKAPRLTIVEPVKDYGTVPKGDKLEWAFVVKNTGDSDLQIIAAKPGCGCTVADFDKVIKPGATGKVTAHVDTTNFAGPIAKSVTLETNDPNTPTAQLTLHAIVKPYVEAYPAGFVRYNLLQGDADSQTVTLYSEEDDPFEITKIEVPGDYVKATYAKIDKKEDLAPNVGRAGQNQYKVTITVGGPDAKIGPLADKIHIYTNSKHQPEYPISISGIVRPTFRVEPAGVNFGEVAPSDSAATRSVLLRSNDTKTPEKFMVTKVESSVPTVVTSIKPGANKGEYEVTLQLAKDSKPGDIDGTVKIFTSDKMNPVVTVPVKGTVKSLAVSAKSSK